MVRGTLVSLIFNRTLDLSITAVSGSAPLTLMSTDVERITSGLFYLHESWANLIQIGVVMYLLERQLGAGCVAPILLSISL
jgi:ATP-binding cassette subfamily C (CFTR/MRP) protein 1